MHRSRRHLLGEGASFLVGFDTFHKNVHFMAMTSDEEVALWLLDHAHVATVAGAPFGAAGAVPPEPFEPVPVDGWVVAFGVPIGVALLALTVMS